MKKILKIPQAQVSKNDNIRSIQELRHFRKFFLAPVDSSIKAGARFEALF